MFKSMFIAVLSSVLLMATTSQGAVVLALETFETPNDFGVWTPTIQGTLTRYYNFPGTDQPSGASTVNFSAPGGTGAVDLRKGGGQLTSPIIPLDTYESPDLTISAYVSIHNGTTTRRTSWEISFDGGNNWITLGLTQTGGGSNLVNNQPALPASITITEGVSGGVKNANLIGANNYAGQAFTDQTVIRFTNTGSAGADYRQFYDNLEVTSSVVIPEPASLMLLGLGSLAMLARRR